MKIHIWRDTPTTLVLDFHDLATRYARMDSDKEVLSLHNIDLVVAQELSQKLLEMLAFIENEKSK